MARRTPPALVLDPDVTGAVVGWRAWEVVPDQDGHPALAGLSGHPWPGPSLAARCVEVAHHQAVPDPHCTCGIYAVTDPSRMPPLPRRRPHYVAFAVLSGRVVLEPARYRAAQAELLGPGRLVLPRSWEQHRTRVSVRHGAYRGMTGPLAWGTPAARWIDDVRRHLRWRYGAVDVSLR